MSRIRTHRIGHFAGLHGAPSLLTWLRSGRRDHRQRLKRKHGPDATQQSSIERYGSPEAADADTRRRYWHWFDVVVTILWVVLLLFVVAYAVVKGETALAQLDGLALIAPYSLPP